MCELQNREAQIKKHSTRKLTHSQVLTSCSRLWVLVDRCGFTKSKAKLVRQKAAMVVDWECN